jgi:predicted aspartyl protease
MVILSFTPRTMKDLEMILKRENYRKIKFRITKTQHLLITAEINGVKGRFILDTGASNTCVCVRNVDLFQLYAKDSKTKAVGAGASDISTQISHNNSLKIGKWKSNDFNIVIIDLSHVNEVMFQSRTKPVQGIIGADVLIKGKALVDYANHYLYLV